jgi:hypothetical protein
VDQRRVTRTGTRWDCGEPLGREAAVPAHYLAAVTTTATKATAATQRGHGIRVLASPLSELCMVLMGAPEKPVQRIVRVPR